MIAEKVIGVYSAVGTLPPAEQANWYRRVAAEHGVTTFEIPIIAGTPVPEELVDVFVDVQASLVVTLVAQWAITGQTISNYGFASLDENIRRRTLIDAHSILQQCVFLAGRGVGIRNFVVHAGRQSGTTIQHSIAMFESLVELRNDLAALLPETGLSVEPADTQPAEHPIPFPAAKKSALNVEALVQVLESVNREPSAGQPASVVANWGRLLIDGGEPLEGILEVTSSEVPLAGVIMSGAGKSSDGYRDSHNSHLDPDSGFTAKDALACAEVLHSSLKSSFIGMKCSRAKGDGEVSVEEILKAQAELLHEVA